MASQLFVELNAEHERLLNLALLGDPPKQDLRMFYSRLRQDKERVTHPKERHMVEYYIMYWRGFLTQSGEYDAVGDNIVANRRSRPF